MAEAAPVAEAAVAEEPVVAEIPEFEAPAAELPVVETPSWDLPTADTAPVWDLPVIEEPPSPRAPILDADFGWDFAPPPPKPGMPPLPLTVELPVEDLELAADLVAEAADVETPVVEMPLVEMPVVEAVAVEQVFEVPWSSRSRWRNTSSRLRLETEIVEAPVVEAPEAKVTPAVDDLKARIEETRRRIRRELEQPFISDAVEAPVADWTISPAVPMERPPLEAKPPIDLAPSSRPLQ